MDNKQRLLLVCRCHPGTKLMNILCVSAFPERRKTIDAELALHGHQTTYIDAPLGREAASRGWKPSPTWRDPYLNRLLTWGELACFAGHHAAWQRAAEMVDGAVIIEDDAKILGPLEFQRRGDIVCLGGRFLADPPEPIDGLIRAPYTYWCVGYWISQEAAKKLLRTTVPKFVLPVDEFIPYHAGTSPYDMIVHGQIPSYGLEVWALPEWLIEPSGRWPSSTEGSDFAFELRTALFATEPEKAKRLCDSLDAHGYGYDVLMAGEPNWDTSGRGGARKLNALSDWLYGLDQSKVHAVALALDGYDTLVLSGPDEVLRRYGGMRSAIVVGGEVNCWPEEELREPLKAWTRPGWPGETEGKAIYDFPCSGTIIGVADVLRDEVAACRAMEVDDDQLAVQKRILSVQQKDLWRVDREAYIFQALNGAEDHLERSKDRIRNIKTNCVPVILHDNGPGSTLDRFVSSSVPAIEQDAKAGQWLQVAPDILAMPLLSSDCAAALAKSAHLTEPWEPLPGDNVPGDELRLKKWDEVRAEEITALLNEHLPTIVESHWRPATFRPPADSFFIRYSSGGQPSIRLHEDVSYLSCSIKLRAACDGGELWFPRQNFSDRLIPAGWLLIWPSRITHPHQVLTVTKGRRISIVVWT